MNDQELNKIIVSVEQLFSHGITAGLVALLVWFGPKIYRAVRQVKADAHEDITKLYADRERIIQQDKADLLAQKKQLEEDTRALEKRWYEKLSSMERQEDVYRSRIADLEAKLLISTQKLEWLQNLKQRRPPSSPPPSPPPGKVTS